MRWPSPVEPVDHLLGVSGEVQLGTLACFDPQLPPRRDYDDVMWTAVRVRFDERWREHHGPIGDWVRALDATGEIVLDAATGALRNAHTNEPLRPSRASPS